MGFISFIPYRAYQVRQSTQGIVEHAWQEVESLTLLGNGADFADYANQGRRYFLDAAKSDWRSSGLLCCYSFLNLAKVLLIKKGIVTSQTMMTTAAYHGLAADLQAPPSIIDFEFTIHPTRAHGRANLFALAYEALMGDAWPFRAPVRVALRAVLPYAIDVGQELFTHFGIAPTMILAQSLLRHQQGEHWYELFVAASRATDVQGAVTACPLSLTAADDVSDYDANDWFLAFGRSKGSIQEHALLTTPRRANITDAQNDATLGFSEFCQLHVVIDRRDPCWYFVPRIEIHGVRLRWHPVLSDYLFAFCLSTILRYEPYLLRPGTRDQYLAEAWTRQSASSVLRYFLMAMTDPAVLVASLS
jgi:hypothetical protein